MQSIPTITVLCGPIGAGVYFLKSWTEQRSIPVVPPLSGDTDLADAWATTLASHQDLGKSALAWLSRRTDRLAEDWGGRLAAMTPHDLVRLWQTHDLIADTAVSSVVARWLIERRVANERLTPQSLVKRLRTELLSDDNAGTHLVSALASLTPTEHWPALLLVPTTSSDPLTSLGKSIRILELWTTAVPLLAAAIVAPEDLVQTFLVQEQSSHSQAMVREGLVAVTGLDGGGLAERLAGQVAGGNVPTASIKRLQKEGVAEELAAPFMDAAQALAHPETPVHEDDARSAAERFLKDLLESLPETVGLFALNQRLEFKHGQSAAEVDFLAAQLKLVIELDGSYYHLTNPEAYRRDRRKDWQLQRHGYLVLRFLSDDVVQRLEEILDTIVAAVEFRRRFIQPGQDLEPS
jgi:hypothetical protein